ncbi:MAG TPA: hypothetical protein VHK90_13040 [Thermoanaerobaculia bacterium]|nr:hypothetical protein [Thermoanaerobaculia bacterium]
MPENQPDKVVRITIENGIPVPDQDPVQCWRNQQKVRWVAEFPFRISVDGYDQLTYSNGGNGNSEHRCTTGIFGDDANKQYKYTIHANGVDNDPTLEIQP